MRFPAHASMRQMQRHQRYLAYLETHGKDRPLPPGGQMQPEQPECAAGTGTLRPGVAGTGNTVFRR